MSGSKKLGAVGRVSAPLPPKMVLKINTKIVSFIGEITLLSLLSFTSSIRISQIGLKRKILESFVDKNKKQKDQELTSESGSEVPSFHFIEK